MEPLRFVHAADLHLDSPFRGMSHESPTLGALERIVDHTIESNSDFLIIAGDIYDSKDRSLRALVSFRNQMERLAEINIPAYIVHGNHDPLNGWGSGFKLPSSVTTFSGRMDTEPFIRRGREVARISGVSYTRERVTDNLASSFKPTSGSPYSIAILHANIGRQAGHADYAPAVIDDLLYAGFDYWALGHVHNRSVLASEPAMVVYPGNPQGRNPRETGPKGCYQVDVDPNGRAHLRFVETNVARWDHIEVSIRGLATIDQLLDDLTQKAHTLAKAFAGPTVVRWTLRGNGPLHRDLQREGMAEEICEELQSIVAAESVRIATGPELDLESLARTESLVSDFVRLSQSALNDPELRRKLLDALTPLFRRKEIGPIDDRRLCEWIEQAGAIGVDLLLDN